MTAINLAKGQSISLAKAAPSLLKIKVGLGWDEASQKKGFFSTLMGNKHELDLDASVFMFDNSKRDVDVIYYNDEASKCGAVQHMGDNRTGGTKLAGVKEDDEVIEVDLTRIPAKFTDLYFVVNIYQAHLRNQEFGMVENAYIHILNTKTNEELVRFDLNEDYTGKYALVVGRLYRKDGNWDFEAIGRPTKDKSVGDLLKSLQ